MNVTLCGYQRGNIRCTQSVGVQSFFCKYHVKGSKQVHPDTFLSVRNMTVVSALDQKPVSGDIKYEWNEIYKFCKTTWRKCCRVCWRYARPIYCRHHDPAHPSTNLHSHSSRIACRFMDELSAELGVEIVHRHADSDHGLFQGHEYHIPDTTFKVDGYTPSTRTVYEFLGDYWHGNPACFPATQKNKSADKTFGELWTATLARLQSIANKGYQVYYIWEKTYKEDARSDSLFQLLTRVDPQPILSLKRKWTREPLKVLTLLPMEDAAESLSSSDTDDRQLWPREQLQRPRIMPRLSEPIPTTEETQRQEEVD